jgi:hypothetical protein
VRTPGNGGGCPIRRHPNSRPWARELRGGAPENLGFWSRCPRRSGTRKWEGRREVRGPPPERRPARDAFAGSLPSTFYDYASCTPLPSFLSMYSSHATANHRLHQPCCTSGSSFVPELVHAAGVESRHSLRSGPAQCPTSFPPCPARSRLFAIAFRTRRSCSFSVSRECISCILI